ncbi:MAG TPA: NAD-binding protein, partial [Pseudomonadales bacterium]|nr:NAD-binding protein [Pseudomonadales bacterium]
AGALAPALAGGFADSKPLQILAPRMANQQFEPVQWRVQTLLKDLENAANLAANSSVNLELAERARELLRRFAEAGHASEDLSSIIGIYTC